MKKWTGWRNCLAMCLAVTMLLTPFLQTEVYAAETANVQGTVACLQPFREILVYGGF